MFSATAIYEKAARAVHRSDRQSLIVEATPATCSTPARQLAGSTRRADYFRE